MSARAQTLKLPTSLRAAACAFIVCLSATATTGAAAWQDAPVSAARVAQEIERLRTAPFDDDGFAQAVSLGFALLGEGRFGEAAELFGALAARRPHDPTALYGAALAVFNLGRAAEAEPLARRAVEAALAAGPDDRAGSMSAPGSKARAADALVLLGVVLAVKGDDAGALKAVGQAAALAPGNFDAQFALGRALYGAGDDAGAARAFRAAVALKPQDARALFFLATALERGGDDAGALAAYGELVAKQPRVAEGHLGLGVLLVKRGGIEADEGVREVERALELGPDLYEARVTLGRTLVARGRAADALEHLRRAAALAPGNPEPHYQLALAYRRLGRREEAASESAIVKRIHETRRAGGASASATPRPDASPQGPDE
jgi:Flp pilus assembly protein TadD